MTMDTAPSPKGFAAKVAVLTAALLALAGLIDAAVAVLTKTESLTCSFAVSLPWCAARTPSRTIADFAGEWKNKNQKTAGITRVLIDQRLNQLYVHAWGACHPTDCDLGTASTPADSAKSGVLEVEWKTSFSIVRGTLTIGQGDQLEFTTKTHFTDNSGRPDYDSTEYLERS